MFLQKHYTTIVLLFQAGILALRYAQIMFLSSMNLFLPEINSIKASAHRQQIYAVSLNRVYFLQLGRSSCSIFSTTIGEAGKSLSSFTIILDDGCA